MLFKKLIQGWIRNASAHQWACGADAINRVPTFPYLASFFKEHNGVPTLAGAKI